MFALAKVLSPPLSGYILQACALAIQVIGVENAAALLLLRASRGPVSSSLSHSLCLFHACVCVWSFVLFFFVGWVKWKCVSARVCNRSWADPVEGPSTSSLETYFLPEMVKNKKKTRRSQARRGSAPRGGGHPAQRGWACVSNTIKWGGSPHLICLFCLWQTNNIGKRSKKIYGVVCFFLCRPTKGNPRQRDQTDAAWKHRVLNRGKRRKQRDTNKDPAEANEQLAQGVLGSFIVKRKAK